jgi:hypothetical protein
MQHYSVDKWYMNEFENPKTIQFKTKGEQADRFYKEESSC